MPDRTNTPWGAFKVSESGLFLRDSTIANATSSRHGLLPKLSGVSTEFLNGLGAFATPAGGGSSPFVCRGRLTLETGVAVSTTDQTGKTSVFWTPYLGAQIALYDGSSTWTTIAFAETTLALGTLTSGKNYDVFGYNNSGTLALEFSAAWSSDTARTDALTTQDGVLVKSGATTRRYLGTIRTTATTTTEDSAAKRFVWNQYNQPRRSMKNATETTDSWTYTTATYRQANANAANQLDYVTGDVATLIEARAFALVGSTAAVGSPNFAATGIGVDSTSVNSAINFGTNIFTAAVASLAEYRGNPGLGRHTITWLEYSGAANTTTWYGDAGVPAAFQSGITGVIWN